MKKSRIKFLQSTFGNDVGDIVTIQHEENDEIYYNDGFRRYCYLLKSEEGIVYKYIPAGKRSNSKIKE